jgi:hypothetical protein
MSNVSSERGNSPTTGVESDARAALIEEIRRYLDAVDTFRATDCEPKWQAEPSAR